LERRRIIFFGHVQGVGFRATARSVASAHQVTGWVRNEADASVAMEVQGRPADVEACLADLRSRMGRFIQGERALTIPAVPDEAAFLVRR